MTDMQASAVSGHRLAECAGAHLRCVPGGRDMSASANAVLVRFTFHAENYPQLVSAYGAAAAQEAVSALWLTLVELTEGWALVELHGDGRVDVEMAPSDFPLVAGPRTSGACSDYTGWLKGLCDAWSRGALVTSAGSVFVWLSASWIEQDASGRQVSASAGVGGRATGARFVGEAVRDDEAWRVRYREDMTVAARVMDSLCEDASGDILVIHTQPVRNARDATEILYGEALARFIGRDGRARPTGDVVRALERLGFVGILDRYVVEEVVAELAARPDLVLAVNISAQSARSEPWWQDVELRLRRDPDLAARLIIEITETTAIPDIDAAVHFCTRMRRLGCRIALDDFGAGHASLRQLMALSPDLVKIDGPYLSRALRSQRDREIFVHIAQLAKALGALVVAEGVENEAQAALAIEAGIIWQQGCYWGAPALTRAWRCSVTHNAWPVGAPFMRFGLVPEQREAWL